MKFYIYISKPINLAISFRYTNNNPFYISQHNILKMSTIPKNVSIIIEDEKFKEIASKDLTDDELIDSFIGFAKEKKISVQNCKDFLIFISKKKRNEKTAIDNILSSAHVYDEILRGVENAWNIRGNKELANLTKNPTFIKHCLPQAPAKNVYPYGGKIQLIVINSSAVEDEGGLPLLFETSMPIEAILPDYFTNAKNLPENTLRTLVPIKTERRLIMSHYQEKEKEPEIFEMEKKEKKDRGEQVNNRNGYGLFTIEAKYHLNDCQFFYEKSDVFPVAILIGCRYYGGSNSNSVEIVKKQSITTLTPMIIFDDMDNKYINEFFWGEHTAKLFAIVFVRTILVDNKKYLLKIVRNTKNAAGAWIADLTTHYVESGSAVISDKANKNLKYSVSIVEQIVKENGDIEFVEAKKFDDIIVSSFPSLHHVDKDGNRSPIYMVYSVFNNSLGETRMNQYRI